MNETIQTIIESKAEIYNSVLITFWLIFLTIIPLMTWAFKSKKTNWGKFFWVWFFTALITGILLTFILIAPEQIAELLIKAKEFIK